MTKLTKNGFSLTEVLVSILVLAGGVIGSAGMQLTAMRTAQQSAFHTAALQLAAEMADRMRANDNQMREADSNNPFLAVDYNVGTDGEPAAPGVMCYAAACNDEQLAAFDIYEWQKHIQDALPGGRAVICGDSSPWDSPSKSFAWDCSAGAGDGASLVIKLGWQGKNPDGSLIRDEDNLFAPSVALIVEPYIR
jgi:type IV pilus assembly protein PilV